MGGYRIGRDHPTGGFTQCDDAQVSVDRIQLHGGLRLREHHGAKRAAQHCRDIVGEVLRISRVHPDDHPFRIHISRAHHGARVALRRRQHRILEIEDDRVRPLQSLTEAIRAIRRAEEHGGAVAEDVGAHPASRICTRTVRVARATTTAS